MKNLINKKPVFKTGNLKEKTNFKWYVIFGTTILEKIKNEIKNRDESIFDGIKRLKDFNYKMIHKIIDDIINQ